MKHAYSAPETPANAIQIRRLFDSIAHSDEFRHRFRFNGAGDSDPNPPPVPVGFRHPLSMPTTVRLGQLVFTAEDASLLPCRSH